MEPMGWGDFLVVFACCAVTMLVCRTVPLFAIKGRQLPVGVERALGFIPPAAFAALVANDLFDPSAGLSWRPLLAAGLVVVVARRTGSLIWCALSGMAAYGLLTLVG